MTKNLVVPTALRVATQWASDYMLRGDKLGSIETGKWADLIVLDKDYLTIPVDEVETIQPQLTMVGGQIVFLSPSFADETKGRPSGAVISTYKRSAETPTLPRGAEPILEFLPGVPGSHGEL